VIINVLADAFSFRLSGTYLAGPLHAGGLSSKSATRYVTDPRLTQRKCGPDPYITIIQVDDDVYNGYHSETEFPSDVDDIEEYKLDWCLDHSCDPNVWYVAKDLVLARRDIAAGEELLYDYATTQANEKMDMQCFCGSESCRGRIRGDDWKLVDLQQRYGFHFLPYILKKIRGALES
jgi:SET domain